VAVMANASEVLIRELDAIPPCEHAQFLRELMGAAAAGLIFTEDLEKATEAVYRLADKIAVMKP
jgi:hypothetical protein